MHPLIESFIEGMWRMFLNKVVSIDNDFPVGCARFYRIWSPWNQQSLLKKAAALLAKSAPTHILNWIVYLTNI